MLLLLLSGHLIGTFSVSIQSQYEVMKKGSRLFARGEGRGGQVGLGWVGLSRLGEGEKGRSCRRMKRLATCPVLKNPPPRRLETSRARFARRTHSYLQYSNNTVALQSTYFRGSPDQVSKPFSTLTINNKSYK